MSARSGSRFVFAVCWAGGGFTDHAKNLVDTVVWYVYSQFGVDYSFQVDCS